MKKNPEFVGQLIPEVSHKCTPGLTFVQCCGSGIRDLVPFDPWIRDPEWFFFRIPELGSWIPNPYFWELSDYFLGKKFHNSLKIGPNFFLQHFKNKIIYNFVKYVTIKKRFETFFFIPLCLAFGRRFCNWPLPIATTRNDGRKQTATSKGSRDPRSHQKGGSRAR
jgi:hypothetical protein